MTDYLPLFMFPTLLILIMTGMPVAFVLSGTAILFGGLGYALDLFYLEDFGFVPARIFGIASNFTLVAVPLFVFMGLTLERSGIAENLLISMSRMLKGVRASLTISVIIVGALLAASTGIVGATVATMGVLALPTMLNQGYDKGLASGTIAASGSLGQVIPPSIVLVILGEMMNVDVGELFAGAIIPGLLLVVLYIVYVFIQGEPSRNDDHAQDQDILACMKAAMPPLVLMVVVLGSILGGVASPTEAASCGAVGALVIAAMRKKLSLSTLSEIGQETALTTSMVFTILVGAQFFGVVFRGLGGDDMISDLILSLEINQFVVLSALMVLVFILGFFLDFLEICFIVIPMVMPITKVLEFDHLWLAILFAINLQTSFLTPPFGFALFYLKGVAPDHVSTGDIYRGIIPFVGIQVLVLLIVVLFPDLVTWLPRHVFN